MATPYEFVDMTPFIREDNLQEEYEAGDQLILLEDAFDVEWLIQENAGDYDGEWYAVFKKDDKYHLFNGKYGSCSSCDDLVDSSPINWLHSYVKNVRAFPSLEAAIKWLQETEEGSYKDIKDRLIYLLTSLQ